jgi:hypothetical protein
MRGKQEDHDKQAEEEVRMANVLKQKPETIESLLKFLIYLVLHKEKEPVTGNPAADSARTAEVQKSLMDLLLENPSLKE